MFRTLKPHQLIVDGVIAAAFAVGVVAVEWRGLLWGSRWQFLGGIIPLLLMAGALVVRRLSPGLALGLAWAGAVGQMTTGGQPGVVDLAIFGVLYATAAYGSRLVFWLGFSSTIVGAAVITLYLFGERLAYVPTWNLIPPALAVLLAALFALLLSWTVGALVRTALRARANRAAQVRAETETAAEQERVRIARDMHDVVAHSLAVVIAQADGARYASASDPAAATQALGTISATARAALSDVRLLLGQLRHSQDVGPQPTLADLEGLYAPLRSTGVDLRVEVDPAPVGDPPAAVQLAVYRILQEALTNALRHGDGGVVAVRIGWRPDRVALIVRNGLAPGPSTASIQLRRIAGASDEGGGHGLVGMRERAQLAGGTLTAAAEDGVFVVRAVLPVRVVAADLAAGGDLAAVLRELGGAA